MQLVIRHVINVALVNELACAETPYLPMMNVNETGTSSRGGNQPVCSDKRLGHDARSNVDPLLVSALDILGCHSGAWMPFGYRTDVLIGFRLAEISPVGILIMFCGQQPAIISARR